MGVSRSLIILLGALAVFAGVVIVAVVVSQDDIRQSVVSFGDSHEGMQQSVDSDDVPRDLRLPFDLADVHPTRGEVNPLGVVRFSKDQADLGHSGIDFPLVERAPIYAVAAGRIVQVKSAGDEWGGQGVWQLLRPTQAGEGWAFIYEHITPAAGVEVGTFLQPGDLVGYKTAPLGFTAHFQLSFIFNDYEFTRGMECWSDYLSTTAAAELDGWWRERRVSPSFLDAWQTVDEEGAFPFRGLLDTAKFPDGPQLCYPPGTDIR